MTGPVVPSDEDELREALAAVLAGEGLVWVARYADALLPVVLADRERYARRRAAEELRAAADWTIRTGYADAAVLREFRDRAAALTREAPENARAE